MKDFLICVLATMWVGGVIAYIHSTRPRWTLETIVDGANCLDQYSFDAMVTETFSNGR